MAIKLEQFIKLQQGSQSVREYLVQFNHLSQYVSENVNTDAKKKQWFIHGLDPEIQKVLTTCSTADYHETVNVAISYEEKDRLCQEARKRKHVHMGFSGGNNQRQKFVYQHGHRFSYRPSQQRGQQQSNIQPTVTSSYPRQLNAMGVRPNNPPNNPNLPCFNCGKVGHFSRECHCRIPENGVVQAKIEKMLRH